ncbi:MXAN_5187 C-terminal domain-containing protein [Vulgatibacter sp.]|uniref:MXAN_5187 C-terminal domain-containing protein n=1 Tax=Vulgatibacter sp. TaxID=1971226 RepID=UPI0035623C2A
MAQPPRNAPPLEKPSRNAYRAAFEQATQVASSAQTLERCAEVEAAVEALRVRYEQFFLGLTRKPPNEDHALVRSAVLQLRSGFVRNTSARFRVQSLHNRFLAYERLWQRTCREIEEGTYRRDLFKARLRRKEPAAAPDDQKAAAELAAFKERLASEPLPSSDDFAVDEAPEELPSAPVQRQAPALRAAPVPARAAAGSVLPDEKMRALYDAYVGAKRRCRESTDGLSFESLSASLRNQVPDLLQKHNASAVDFKVVIKGGKAVLKAVPR